MHAILCKFISSAYLTLFQGYISSVLAINLRIVFDPVEYTSKTCSRFKKFYLVLVIPRFQIYITILDKVTRRVLFGFVFRTVCLEHQIGKRFYTFLLQKLLTRRKIGDPFKTFWLFTLGTPHSNKLDYLTRKTYIVLRVFAFFHRLQTTPFVRELVLPFLVTNVSDESKTSLSLPKICLTRRAAAQTVFFCFCFQSSRVLLLY